MTKQIHIHGMSQTNANPLLWRHNRRDGASNHQPHDCLFNRPFRRRSKKTSKLRVIDLCAGNSLVTGEFPAQRASNAENVSIWWRLHAKASDTQSHGYKILWWDPVHGCTANPYKCVHGSRFVVLWWGLVEVDFPLCFRVTLLAHFRCSHSDE